MDSFEELIYDSINSYFKILSNTGHIKKSDTIEFLVLSFIDDILSLADYGFITEEDYLHIVNAIYCICGESCAIQFPKFNVVGGLIITDKNLRPRVTEDFILRQTEVSIPRIKA